MLNDQLLFVYVCFSELRYIRPALREILCFHVFFTQSFNLCIAFMFFIFLVIAYNITCVPKRN